MIAQANQSHALFIRELSLQETYGVNGGYNFKKALDIALDIINLIAIVCPRTPHHKEPRE